MAEDLLHIVPDSRREAAREAIADVLGRQPLEAITPVLGGASGALIYRLETAARPYLLRLEALQQVGMRDPQRTLACMWAAASAGLAPALMYADGPRGVSVMDFIATRPLTEHPGGADGLARALGELIGQVHAIQPPFAAPRANYLDIVAFLMGALRRPGLFATGLLDRHLEGFERIRAAYRWDEAGLVSGHNDPNPRNILYDGKRLWLIDWEISFRNDPLVDLAILANEFANTPELETVLVKASTGRAPDRVLRARLRLMRQLTRLFYAGVILGASGFGRSEPDADLSAPTAAEFQAAVACGRLKGPGLGAVYGKIILAAYLAGLDEPWLEDALAIAAG
jgi:aminoglycoside phosphotransferase (APT) family kinase protein